MLQDVKDVALRQMENDLLEGDTTRMLELVVLLLVPSRSTALKGFSVPEKSILRRCLNTLSERSVDLVDAYVAAILLAATGIYGVLHDSGSSFAPELLVESVVCSVGCPA